MSKVRSQKLLLNWFDAMNQVGQQALLEYAEFLSIRHQITESVSQEPLLIERPVDESVVVAIRRLRKTYPMLDTQQLLHETSAFMMQHMMQGRSAKEVVDDLEIYFKQQFEAFVK